MAVKRRLRLRAPFVRVLSKMIQERSQKRRVQVLHRQLGWCFGQLLLGKLQKQTKRISVRSDGMGTGFTLGDETSREERLQKAREADCVFHQIPSQRLSSRCPTAAISSGVPVTYQ